MFHVLSILFLLHSTYAAMPSANYTFQAINIQTIDKTTESVIIVPVLISAAIAVGCALILSCMLYRYCNKHVRANEHDYQTVYNF